MKNIFKRFFSNWAINFYIFLALAVFFVLYKHDKKVGFDKVDWEGIWVEAHGMFFDILILGLLLAIYDHFREKRDKIERYKEEIDDYRFWNEQEATHRIRGNIRRLVKLGAKGINLNGCYLANVIMHGEDLGGNFLFETNFENASLYGTNFRGCMGMEKINFKNCKLVFCDFVYTRISYSDFSGSEIAYSGLGGTSFYDCKMVDCNLIFSDLRQARFYRTDLTNATAVEYQRELLVQAGADVSKMNFLPNPDNFEEYKEIYEAGRAFELWEKAMDKGFEERYGKKPPKR